MNRTSTSQARTSLLGLFDADMLPSFTLYSDLMELSSLKRYV